MLEFTFSEMLWQPMKGFRVAPGKTARAGAKLLIPQEEVARVMSEVGPAAGADRPAQAGRHQGHRGGLVRHARMLWISVSTLESCNGRRAPYRSLHDSHA